MLLRGFCYVVIGWLLIAVVGGLAEVLALSVMLPATSAVIIAHVAFSRSRSLPFALIVAIALGYLEDLHQGAPVGTLSLAHALAVLVLCYGSGRLQLSGWLIRAAVCGLSVVLVDTCTVAILLALAEPFAVQRSALLAAATQLHWHALATVLVAPPVWGLLDRVFSAMRLDDRPASQVYWKGKG
jgi:cell shape-determining protein MreD